MTEFGLLALIGAHVNTFTKAEAKVAQYVLAHPHETLYTSITDLAEQCGVADSTVFRFCKTLKLKGYQDFKLRLAQSVSRSPDANPMEGDVEIGASDDLREVASKAVAASTRVLQSTAELIDYADLEEAATMLVAAKRVVVCGVGTSLITALDVSAKFLRITEKFVCHSDAHLQAISTASLMPGDVALIISFSGATKDMVQIAGLARDRGAKVICISRFSKSPLASQSHITLLCGANEDPLQGGSMAGKMSQLLLLEILYRAYYRLTFEESSGHNERAAASVLEKLY
jgi:Transcriptional regulators